VRYSLKVLSASLCLCVRRDSLSFLRPHALHPWPCPPPHTWYTWYT
jgi:hypothetical protein